MASPRRFNPEPTFIHLLPSVATRQLGFATNEFQLGSRSTGITVKERKFYSFISMCLLKYIDD